MELSEFSFKVMFLFLPGIISFILIDKLTHHKEAKIHTILINSFILGVFCYCFYNLIILTLNIIVDTKIKCLFFKGLANKTITIDFKEIFFVGLISIFVGFVFAALINHRILHRFARKIKVSKKFGDVDVWSYIMNAKETKDASWIVIRDKENDLMYEGWVSLFSDSTEEDELFLRDVKVFRDSDAEELYEVPALYLPRRKESLVIEFPLLKFSEYKERHPKKEKKNE